MALSGADRVQKHRARKRMRSIDISDDALQKLKLYQERWRLPSLSVAVSHAVTFSKPE